MSSSLSAKCFQAHCVILARARKSSYLILFVDKETETEQVMDLGWNPGLLLSSYSFYQSQWPPVTSPPPPPPCPSLNASVQPSSSRSFSSRFFGLVIVDNMLPVSFLLTQLLTQPETRQKQVGSEGAQEHSAENVVPPQCTLGSGVCVSRSDHSLLVTFGGCCCFPFPLCLDFTKKNPDLGLGEPGFRTLADLLQVLTLSLSCHVTL